ncbi:MAG: proline dehydrogenase family protein [Bacteroidota bacterium]
MEKAATNINFNNTELAFKAKSDKELKRSYRLFRMIDNPFLTKVGPKLMMLGFKLRLPIKGIVRRTLFDIFVGGETLEETIKVSSYLDTFGVKTILDYSVEGEKTEEGFDKTLNEIIDAVKHGGRIQEVVFAACKLTGLADMDLMTKIQAGEKLAESEVKAKARVAERMDELAAVAKLHDTPIFIDAEDSWIQDYIDELAEEMMERYNKDKCYVYTTVQLYRHDRLAYLRGLIRRSEEKGYILGVKLVRGAYMEKEAERAEEMGYENPIQPDKASTDRDYNAALKLCINHLDHVAICAGTHNEASSLLLAELLEEKGLSPDHPHIWFAQLLGMSDNISFNLAHNGFNVAKYLPYGPVKAVMPYLIRRAEENTSVAGQASRETDLLSKEVKRRKTSI